MVKPKFIAGVKMLLLPLVGYLGAVFLSSTMSGFLQTEDRDLADYALSSVLDLFMVVGIYFFIVRKLENRPIKELHFGFKATLYSILAAVMILGLPTCMLFLLKYYQVIEVRAWTFLPFAATALFLQGIGSEILLRGIFLRNMISWLGKNRAVILSCTLYACLNLLIDGVHFQVFVGHWLFFCMLSLLYLKTENLWVTGAFHGTWLIVAFLPGVIDEHWRDGSLIISKVEGERWLTGGQWGAELSLFCIAVMSAVSVYLYLNQKATEKTLGNVD